MRVLVYGDGPSVTTGFGTVIRNIFLPLHEKGLFTDINFVAINYTGDPHDLPFKCYPAKNALHMDPDPYGRQRFLDEATGGRWPFDLLFVLQDHFTVQPFLPPMVDVLRKQVAAGQRPPFKVIYYIPVDHDYVPAHFIGWIPQWVDYPVAYMQWSRKVMVETIPALDPLMRVIHHGTEPETFFPLPEHERQQFRAGAMQVRPDQPLIVCVNRNQPRKDPGRTVHIFAEVRRQFPNAVLYLHMNPQDSMGHDIGMLASQLRLPDGVVRFPSNFSEAVGFPRPVLNQIYNAADVVLTAAHGEGWGLNVSDAMTVGKCVVAPRHTAFAEMLAKDRGLLVSPMSVREVLPHDNNLMRLTADVEGMAEKVVWALRNPTHAAGIGKRARAWALENTWRGAVVPQWEALFREAYAALPQQPAVPAPPPAAAVEARPGLWQGVIG